MMHTAARTDCKEQKKRYAEAGWKGGMTTTIWDCALPMDGSSIMMNSASEQ